MVFGCGGMSHIYAARKRSLLRINFVCSALLPPHFSSFINHKCHSWSFPRPTDHIRHKTCGQIKLFWLQIRENDTYPQIRNEKTLIFFEIWKKKNNISLPPLLLILVIEYFNFLKDSLSLYQSLTMVSNKSTHIK